MLAGVCVAALKGKEAINMLKYILWLYGIKDDIERLLLVV